MSTTATEKPATAVSLEERLEKLISLLENRLQPCGDCQKSVGFCSVCESDADECVGPFIVPGQCYGRDACGCKSAGINLEARRNAAIRCRAEKHGCVI